MELGAVDEMKPEDGGDEALSAVDHFRKAVRP